MILNISKEDKEDLLKGKADFCAFSYYNSNCVATSTKEGEKQQEIYHLEKESLFKII